MSAVKKINGATLTKAEIADEIFNNTGISRKDAKDIVHDFFDLIVDALEEGEVVKLINFGNFELIDKAERPGRNPRTGEVVPVSARRVVTFHASPRLKDSIDTLSKK